MTTSGSDPFLNRWVGCPWPVSEKGRSFPGATHCAVMTFSTNGDHRGAPGSKASPVGGRGPLTWKSREGAVCPLQ